MALLIIKQRGLETKSRPLDNGTVTIGRSTGNDIPLANRYASGRHCEVRCESGRYAIYDLNSTNGLFVNGAKVTIRVLEDGDRILAGAAQLVFIADEGAIHPDSLIIRLKKGDANERELAATLLGQMAITSSAVHIAKALKEDSDTKVKAAAAEALGFLNEPTANKALLANFDTQDALLRNAVVRAIIRIADEKLLEEVARFLKHPERKVRVLAAYVLGQTHGAHSALHLQQALRDEWFEVREAAVKALGDLGDPNSVDSLLDAARDQKRYPFVWVIDSLGKIGHQKAVPALMTALQHQNIEVKEAAIDGLGRLRAPEAVPALISLLQDPHEKIRKSTSRALEKLRRFIEMEQKLATAESHQTMEIAALGERDSAAIPGQPLFGEDKSAWENWWAQQSGSGRS